MQGRGGMPSPVLSSCLPAVLRQITGDISMPADIRRRPAHLRVDQLLEDHALPAVSVVGFAG